MTHYIYATVRSGQTFKFPHVDRPLEKTEIARRLVSAGVPLSDIQNTGFSLTPFTRSLAFTVDERAEIAAATSEWPAFPQPNENNMLPGYSAIETAKCVGLDEIKRDGGKYFMQRPGAGWVDVLSLGKEAFQNPDDYDKIHNGAVTLCAGKVWKLADQQNIPPELESYENTSIYRSGTTEKTTLEIEATLGYEGYGASVSLRVLFRKEFTVTTETEQTEKFTLFGEEGKTKIFSLWQECDIFTVEVDGVRKKDPLYTLDLLDKPGTIYETPYFVLDRFDGLENPQVRSQAHFYNV